MWAVSLGHVTHYHESDGFWKTYLSSAIVLACLGGINIIFTSGIQYYKFKMIVDIHGILIKYNCTSSIIITIPGVWTGQPTGLWTGL